MRSEHDDADVAPEEVDVDLTLSSAASEPPPTCSFSPRGDSLKELLLRTVSEAAENVAAELFAVLDLDSIAIKLDVYAHHASDGTFQLAQTTQTAASAAALPATAVTVISLGKVHTPSHYFLLLADQSVHGEPEAADIPLARAADGLYYGRVSLVGLEGITSAAVVCDLGQYPWGALPADSPDDVKQVVSALTAVCKHLGIDTKSGSMNRCAAVHIIGALFRARVLTLQELCAALGTSGNVDLSPLPQSVIDALDEVLESDSPCSDSDPKISATVFVPALNKHVFKSTILREFNATRGVGRVSADRTVRYGASRSEHAAAQAAQARLSVDAHICKLFDDIAIKFEYDGDELGAEFGRIVRMRKRVGKKWLDYVRPVDLNDREEVSNLFVTCYYYRKIQGSNRYFIVVFTVYHRIIAIHDVKVVRVRIGAVTDTPMTQAGTRQLKSRQ
jgi:hypothetical protein